MKFFHACIPQQCLQVFLCVLSLWKEWCFTFYAWYGKMAGLRFNIYVALQSILYSHWQHSKWNICYRSQCLSHLISRVHWWWGNLCSTIAHNIFSETIIVVEICKIGLLFYLLIWHDVINSEANANKICPRLRFTEAFCCHQHCANSFCSRLWFYGHCLLVVMAHTHVSWGLRINWMLIVNYLLF